MPVPPSTLLGTALSEHFPFEYRLYHLYPSGNGVSQWQQRYGEAGGEGPLQNEHIIDDLSCSLRQSRVGQPPQSASTCR
jgi:hypothetical protein